MNALDENLEAATAPRLAAQASGNPRSPARQPWTLVPLLTVSGVTGLTFLFAWLQNRNGWVGGSISPAKTLWLNLTVLLFLVLPFLLWRNRKLAPRIRTLFGLVLASFALRGGIELYLLYFTNGWRCGYGIGHDLLTFALIAGCRRRAAAGRPEQDRRALAFATLVQVALLVECFMAWQFSRLASPADGIYFAADNPHFRFVNNASWVAVALGYPWLGGLLWRSRHDFTLYENPKTPEPGDAGCGVERSADLPIV